MRPCIERSLLHSDCGEAGGEFLFSFAESEGVFLGHFPGYPILPGVFQLEMARFACERGTGRRLEIEKIKKAKFTRPILPEEPVSLSVIIQPRDGAWHVQAAFSVRGEEAGSASMILHGRICD
jgi:3-hydroxyacyl-[acyl-carrier-protein] dehydratase